MRKLLFISFLLLQIFGNSVTTKAQAAYSYDVLTSDLETQLRKGNRRALRDLAGLLDKPVYHETAIILFETYTFFTKEEIDIEHTTRDQFMRFYFNNEDKIKHSEVLQAFYITPVEFQTYNFAVTSAPEKPEDDPSVLLRSWVIEFDKSFKKGADSMILQKIIEKIAALETRESFQWLRNMLTSMPFNKNATNLYIALCEGLKNEPNVENLNGVLAAIDKNIVPAEWLTSTLIELTNYTVTSQQTRQLLDSLESYEALRAYGYEQILPFKEVFFYEKVDYYAKILSRKDTPWIQRNALRDMMATQHPRLLFYLAAQMRWKPNERAMYEKLIKKRSNTQFLLPCESAELRGGQFIAKIDYIQKYKNFVRYWANHSEDYEWDESRRLFVNKAEIAQRTEEYERLFRRLNSENDSVARASFLQLAQGDPTAIAELTEKYRSLLRNYNRNLPDIHYGFLEQMTRLVAFCKKNKMSYQLSGKMDSLMHILYENRNPQTRFTIENQIIKYAEIDDLTPIEFYGCLYSSNQEMSFSIGRILDFLYTKLWTPITNNDDQLRFFLKKSFLFKKIGVVGICNSYQNKIDKIENELKTRFSEIAAVESDEDIINQINVVIGAAEDNKKETKSKSMFDLFLNDPLSFANGDMKMLPAPRESDYQRIVGKIQSENDKEVLRLMMDYLDLHPSIEAVPQLFAVIMDDRKIKSHENSGTYERDEANGIKGIRVSDRVVILLENIYAHSLKADDKRAVWRRMWYKDQKNYRIWDKQFFEEQVLFLKTSESPSMDDILEVSKSKYFTSKHKPLIINGLKRLSTFSDIRFFKSFIPFKVSEDLAAFDTLNIGQKDLDDFIKIFETDNDSTMWSFINRKTQAYSLDDLGSFYNALFKVDWFLKQVFNEKISDYQKKIAIETLSNYLTNSELISEFEEQTTLRHVAELQNIGLSLSEKLEASFTLDVSEESKAAIQEAILMRINFSQIGTVAGYFEKLSKKPGYNPTAFLYKDFGIPIFNPDKESIAQLIENHRVMKEIDFYKFYLKRFGVDFSLENDELDFNKIYNILKFEIVAPFTGGGFQRDYFTYGVIKLLELQFKTRLGFHEKLNENQSFYTYSPTKRAVKWMQYLEANHYVKPDPSVPASFNRLFAGN